MSAALDDRPLVLNVNDHVANLYMVSMMLKRAGYRIAEARNGAQALEVANRDQPALIVLDVRLPDVDGFEVCRRLKADPRTQDIKVLHTSASFVTTQNKVDGLEAGADGYLTQPFEPQDLIATVRSLLRLGAAETVLKARNDDLIEADRRKDEFLAMLAHELRNPLAALQLGLPILERFAPRDPLEARALGAMRRQTSLLTQLVDDMLDVSRVTRGRIDLHLVDLELTALVTLVCDGLVERVLAPRNQKLVMHLPDPPIYVAGDAGRIEQILTNLLDNASKYSDDGAMIEIAARIETGQVVLEVKDRGIGMDQAILPNIFELFAQAPTTLARSRGGLGIGLTLVKTLVEMHGGTISATSDGLGTGTTVTLRLPLRSAAAAIEQPSDAIVIAEGTRKILLVDDNEDARDLLRSLCELQGHVVFDAGEGTGGVQLALDRRPDIAFIDIGLPGIDGYEVARQIRRGLTDYSPVLIALSGYGSQTDRENALAAGFDEHVAKPISMARVKSLIATAPKLAR